MSSEKERELARLETRLSFIKGRMAPPRTWIQKFVVPKKNGKKYYYYRLMEACDKKSPSGAIQGKLKLYLGNKHSSKYHTYKAAIERRNELQVLEKRYKQLMALYQKAVQSSVSVGFEGETIFLDREEKTVTNQPEQDSIVNRELVKAVERIQDKIDRLWQWISLIGEKLGVSVPAEMISSG